eukprot:11559226-Karenia_brevis.AAC.1
MMFLPHVMFASYFSTNPTYFKDMFLGGIRGDTEGLLETFWNEVEARGDPRLQGHPMTRRRDWKKFGIPISLHGDDIPTLGTYRPGTQSLRVLSWQGLLAKGSTMSVKLIIASIFQVAIL